MFKVPADNYPAICKDLMASFELALVGSPLSDSLSLVFQDYRRSSQVVGLEWDNWSGFTVVAKSPESEPLVQAIAQWLRSSKWAESASSAQLGAAKQS